MYLVHSNSFIIFSSGKILEGVTFEKILDCIRDNVESLTDPIAMVERKALLNIQRSFGLIDGRSHQSDYVSVSLWIKRMNELPENENPIIFHDETEGLFSDDCYRISTRNSSKVRLKLVLYRFDPWHK